MQGTEHDTSSEEATAAKAAAATGAVHAALTGGRPADARARATAALERHGPDPTLYVLLGQAHAAENEDDHDDEAERTYRRGLEAFPDDLNLLAAYAELCLESDAVDHPGRNARGPVLTARLQELAPDSPQALHVGRHARGETPASGVLSKAAAAHIQRHDVRAALAAAPRLAEAARLAEEQALAYPYDQRLAIRAETLTELDRPGRRLLLAHVRAPLATLLTVTVIASTLTIARAALHLPGWVSTLAVLLFVPGLALVSLERHAQTRGLARLRTPPDDAGLPESPLPPPPPISSRQVAVNLAVLCVLLCSAASPLLWPSPGNKDYPRYAPTAPATLLGAPLLSATDGTGQGTPAMWTETFDNSFLYLYGTPDRMTDDGAGPSAYVFGGIGDLHDAPADLIEGYEGGLAGTESTIDATWDAPPGARGGRLHCVSYATESENAGAHTACTWLDRGSLGIVVMNEPGLAHETAAETARTTRDAILQEDGSGGTEASVPGNLRVL